MRVTLFANVSPKSNPYIALLQQAIQPYCDEPVTVLPRFTLGWVLRHGQSGNIAHIHWIEHHLNPHPWFGSGATGYRYLINKLGNNRFSHPVRAAVLLAKLAVALVWARRAGVRVVYTVHNLMAHHQLNGYYSFLEQLANRFIFGWADMVHVHSRYAADAVAQRYGRTQNVFVVPLGNYMGWYANTVSRTNARRRLNLPDDAFVFLFFGQIAPYKGLENLMEAFVAMDDNAARLVIAGKVAVADYGAQIAALARDARILYQPGFVPDDNVQVYLNAADTVVFPFRQITTSSSVLLAFSFGRPVVAPTLGGLPEVVPSAAGLLYSPEEPDGLQAALRRARNSSWSSQAILAHARQFDWRVIGGQIADIYRTALPAPKTASSSQKEQA